MSRPTSLFAKFTNPSQAIFTATVFCSAVLVFSVQPMIAKMVLPLLGGGPSIWNTSMVFFQAVLLVGYGYAHLLQRLRSLKLQASIHIALLIVAALALPLAIHQPFGPPTPSQPVLWLLGVLSLSVGAPFAVLSATAPLVQAWHARAFSQQLGAEPYKLYAASNLGSLASLLAYPIIFEPLATVGAQSWSWSFGYGLFALLMAALAASMFRIGAAEKAVPSEIGKREAIGWKRVLAWVALAAAPSSLMLGVTTHITTDIASAPFLWVLPLALYLLTFIIAFSDRPIAPRNVILAVQAVITVVCIVLAPFLGVPIFGQLFLHLAAFFLTALICHQRLVDLRPSAEHLTAFYFCLSLGGVLGGSINAFLAPVLLDNTYEYQAMMVLACLARPNLGRLDQKDWVILATGVVMALMAPAALLIWGYETDALDTARLLVLLVAAAFAVFVQHRVLMYVLLIGLLAVCAEYVGDRRDDGASVRNFYGVISVSLDEDDEFGETKLMTYGTTIHGIQATSPENLCTPLYYYSNRTPIGQVLRYEFQQPKTMHAAVIGLGTGTIAAFTKPGDRLTYFEINPMVVDLAMDPEIFSYTSTCAKGKVDVVLGDARLTLAGRGNGQFDLLMVDAFTSDSIPAHLMTTEAIRMYLSKLKPDGVLVMHISNRHLELGGPAMAGLRAAGGFGLIQSSPGADEGMHEPPTMLVIGSKSKGALEHFAKQPQWLSQEPYKARAWTDDYMNLPGALIRNLSVH